MRIGFAPIGTSLYYFPIKEDLKNISVVDRMHYKYQLMEYSKEGIF
jgi:hypothetical protein